MHFMGHIRYVSHVDDGAAAAGIDPILRYHLASSCLAALHNTKKRTQLRLDPRAFAILLLLAIIQQQARFYCYRIE